MAGTVQPEFPSVNFVRAVLVALRFALFIASRGMGECCSCERGLWRLAEVVTLDPMLWPAVTVEIPEEDRAHVVNEEFFLPV